MPCRIYQRGGHGAKPPAPPRAAGPTQPSTSKCQGSSNHAPDAPSHFLLDSHLAPCTRISKTECKNRGQASPKHNSKLFPRKVTGAVEKTLESRGKAMSTRERSLEVPARPPREISCIPIIDVGPPPPAPLGSYSILILPPPPPHTAEPQNSSSSSCTPAPIFGWKLKKKKTNHKNGARNKATGQVKRGPERKKRAGRRKKIQLAAQSLATRDSAVSPGHHWPAAAFVWQ